MFIWGKRGEDLHCSHYRTLVLTDKINVAQTSFAKTTGLLDADKRRQPVFSCRLNTPLSKLVSFVKFRTELLTRRFPVNNPPFFVMQPMSFASIVPTPMRENPTVYFDSRYVLNEKAG
jgi:hypothetical protein